MPVVGSVRSVLDPRTAIYTVRVPLADIPDGVTVRVRAVGAVDGVEQAAEFEVTGGAQFDKDGNPRTEAVLAWTLPHGFFGTKDARPEDWSAMRAQRWGQTAKSTFTLRTEIEAVKGQIRDLPACTDSVAVQAADEKQRYHHSIAIENATSAVEEGGDGTISVSFTANTGSNRAALVVSGSDRSGQVGTHTTTYGGSGPSVTRPWNVTDGSYSRCTGDVFKDSEIGSGAKTVQNVCDVSTDGGTTIAVLCLSGVDQTTPVGTAQTAASTGGSPSVTVTGLNSTDVIVDGLYMWGAPGAIGANQTQQTTAGGANNHTNVSTQSGADGGVMSWTGSGGEYSYGAVAFKEAAASGATATGAPRIPFFNTAGTAVQTQTATGAPNLPKLNTTGQAVQVPKASGTPSLPFINATGTAVQTQTASGTPSLPFLSTDGSAVTGAFSATGAPGLPFLSASGSAVMLPSATGAPSLPFLSAAGSALHTQTASGAPALPFLSAVGVAVFGSAASATGTPSLPFLNTAGTALQTQSASGTPSLPFLSASGSAIFGSAATATGTPSLPFMSTTGTAAQTHAATGTPSLPFLSASGAAVSVPSATGAPSLPFMSATGASSVRYTATGAPNLPSLGASGAAFFGDALGVIALALARWAPVASANARYARDATASARFTQDATASARNE